LRWTRRQSQSRDFLKQDSISDVPDGKAEKQERLGSIGARVSREPLIALAGRLGQSKPHGSHESMEVMHRRYSCISFFWNVSARLSVHRSGENECSRGRTGDLRHEIIPLTREELSFRRQRIGSFVECSCHNVPDLALLVSSRLSSPQCLFTVNEMLTEIYLSPPLHTHR
jgi:hypothetical protein